MAKSALQGRDRLLSEGQFVVCRCFTTSGKRGKRYWLSLIKRSGQRRRGVESRDRMEERSQSEGRESVDEKFERVMTEGW